MKQRALHRALLPVFAVLALATRPARAAEEDVGQAKIYFKAGAAAYTAGDYQAAIQALDAAYRLTPLPAIAFSLAQAERRQYFVSREREHLDRAIELYRTYLARVPTGGRRADATDALGQLEPLALAAGAAPSSGGAPAAEAEKTRVLVTTEAPKASVSLDGAAPVAAPLIAEVTPGRHHVKVEARGFFASERAVVAVAGALVPIEVNLRIRPAVVDLRGPPGADLYIDGRFAAKVEKANRVELAGGPHVFTFAKKGHRLKTVRLELEPGETRELRSDLEQTSQRSAAYATLVASGVSLIATGVFAGLALGQEAKAGDIRDQQVAGNIDPEALSDYEEALDRRGQFRAASIASALVFGGTLVTGICLHEFDHPDVHEQPPFRTGRTRRAPGLALVDGPGDAGAALRLAF
jgi:tetratricopeptide (TPR) repeat protein